MSVKEPPLTVGIEEEYMLVDLETRDLAAAPAPMLGECEERLAGQITAEFFQSQIEVETPICRSVGEARASLALLRGTVAELARRYKLAPIAASTHPFATWREQKLTEKRRYRVIADDMQGIGRRMIVSGIHVHVGVDDDDLRIDLMNQLSYFVPHLLCLSTSSPFWEGEKTGLMSYRVSVFDTLPRSGLPDAFVSYAEYERMVEQLVRAGVCQDATHLWWDIRPSARFPTLEVRVTDVCTRLDDAATVAALCQCLIRRLYRLRRDNQRWRTYPRVLIHENKWRAQRYGTEGKLIDFGKSEAVPYAELLDELIEFVREDAESLGCLAEVEHAREIVERGTSAHQQLAVWRKAIAKGADPHEAMSRVVDFLIAETVAGLAAPDEAGISAGQAYD